MSRELGCPFCDLLGQRRPDAAQPRDEGRMRSRRETEEGRDRRGGEAAAGRPLVAENSLAVALRDGFPVNPGHTLIIPRRHVPTWFRPRTGECRGPTEGESGNEAAREEQLAILDLADQVKAQLDADGVPVPAFPRGTRNAAPGTLVPDGYNLGLNCGTAAGQTVPHLHLHLIPRFRGDVDDPTGGVRFVVPSRGNYRKPGFIPTAGEESLRTKPRPLEDEA